MTEDELLTTQQAAEYAGLSQSHMQNLLRKGKIRGRRIGARLWVTTKADIDNYLASDRRPGPKKKQES